MEKQILKLIDEDGKEKEYEIIVAYKWFKTNKNYVVFTDNSKNEKNEVNIYAAIYYPDDLTKIDFELNDSEWEEVERKLKEVINNE